jgi:arsenate reductase (thioredoxin)
VTDKPTVLFVCFHNANRSQIAAGYLHHLAGDHVQVLSAGPQPAQHLNPGAVEAMSEDGIDISAAQPQRLTDQTLDTADVIITLGCAEDVPVQPGKRYEEWTLTGGGEGMEAARTVRDQIRPRVENLAADLLS